MRDVKGGGKSSNPNPNVLFLHVVQILFLIPFQVTKMNIIPSNFLQIIILTTGVKRGPTQQVITCLVPLERTPTIPNSYRAPLTSLFLSTNGIFFHVPIPIFIASQPKANVQVRFQNTTLFF